MKKVIGIIDPGWVEYTDTSDLLKGRGGSETWTVQISHELQQRGYHVIVFCKVNEWHFNAFGVEWMPIHLFESRAQYQKFEHIIISRKVGHNLDIIRNSNCCDNVWIQAHDVWVSSEDNNDPADLKYYFLNYNCLKGVICLSNSHCDWVIDKNGVDRDLIHITGNGLILEPFEDIDFYSNHRSFNLFWSSRPERGLDLMINEIMPRIRKVHPESRLRVASYDNIPVNGNYDYVDFLGNLPKERLYEEMSNCRVWVYPAIFPETFCITALENIECGCIPIVPKRDGMETTFGPFTAMMMPDCVFETPDNYDLISKAALYYMDNYNQRAVLDLRLSLANYIDQNYKWSNIVDKFERIWTCTSMV